MSIDTLASLCLATRPPTTPDSLWRDWSLAPALLAPLLLLPVLYALGLRRGRRRGPRPGAVQASAAQAVAFAGAWLLLAIALLSPLCRLAASLASAHMVQHVILVALAPPLLVIGGTGAALRRALPLLPRPGRLPLGPTAASILYAAAIWLAHLRPVYEAALLDPFAHLALLLLLLAAALIFWARLAAAGGAAIPMAAGALVQTGLLGALLTFAPAPWYPLFAGRTQAWGLTLIEDQQLAGLIMWVPMGAVYLAAGLVALGALLGRSPAPLHGGRGTG